MSFVPIDVHLEYVEKSFEIKQTKKKPLNTLSSCTCSTYLEIYQSLLFLLASFLFLFLSLLASAVLIFCQSQKWRRSLIVLWWFTNHYCVNMQWPRPNNAWQLFLHAESSVFVKNIRKRTDVIMWLQLLWKSKLKVLDFHWPILIFSSEKASTNF